LNPRNVSFFIALEIRQRQIPQAEYVFRQRKKEREKRKHDLAQFAIDACRDASGDKYNELLQLLFRVRALRDVVML